MEMARRTEKYSPGECKHQDEEEVDDPPCHLGSVNSRDMIMLPNVPEKTKKAQTWTKTAMLHEWTASVYCGYDKAPWGNARRGRKILP